MGLFGGTLNAMIIANVPRNLPTIAWTATLDPGYHSFSKWAIVRRLNKLRASVEFNPTEFDTTDDIATFERVFYSTSSLIINPWQLNVPKLLVNMPNISWKAMLAFLGCIKRPPDYPTLTLRSYEARQSRSKQHRHDSLKKG